MLKKITLILFLLLITTACAESPPLEDGLSNVYQVGDEWTYQTRPGEPLSTFIVTKIDKTVIDEQETTIIHVAINDLNIDHPEGGQVTAVPHMPFTETALFRSALQPFDVVDPIPQEYLDAYQNWADRYQAGSASVFNVTIATALTTVQATVQSSN